MEKINCKYCGSAFNLDAQFCSNCGKQVKGESIDYSDKNKKYFIRTIVLYVLLVMFLGTFYVISQHSDNLSSEIVINSLFFCTVLAFVIIDPKPFFILIYPKFNLKPLLIILGFIVIFFPTVTIIVNFINSQLTNLNFQYTDQYFNTSHPILFAYLFTSVLPGILEEFMFRGIMFNQLLFLTNPKMTILITAITFSFVHFSFLALLWLIPFGIFLGYLRFRYRTMLYSIFCHMLYNAVIITSEIIM